MSLYSSLNCSLAPHWLLDFYLPDTVPCPHSSQSNPINYEYIISAQNLQRLFISLRTLWPSRFHIRWPANLFNFLFCPTSLLEVSSFCLGLFHVEKAKPTFTQPLHLHILCLWSSSQRYFLDSPTSIRFLLECPLIPISLLLLAQPIKIAPFASLSIPSSLSYFFSQYLSLLAYYTIYCLPSPTAIRATWYQELPFAHCYNPAPRPVPGTR